MCTLDVKVATHKKSKRTKSSSAPTSSSASFLSTSSLSYSSSSAGHKSGLKWKIIISSIIFLICRISHVLAIRKGRLMSPSSFTALSGDLHVQIQFSADELRYDETTSTTMRAVLGKIGNTTTSNIENTITTTLVISKYVDDVVALSPPLLTTTVLHNDVVEKTLKVNSANSSNTSAPVSVNSTNLANSTNLTNTEHSTNSAVWYLINTLNSSDNIGHDEPILQRKRKEIVQNIQLYPDPRHNVTQIAVPCQTFVQGGLYEMQVVTNVKTTARVPQTNSNSTMTSTPRGPIPTITTTTLMPASDERLRQTLDVRWPSAEMRVSPVRLKTYPENSVEVELRFPEVNCDKAWLSNNLPEFWLELIYCGKDSTCAQQMPANLTKSSILYAEQIHGYPKQKKLQLKCHLFGLAGNYAVQLRPMIPMPHLPVTRRFLSVDWSDKFVFNVYARSIFPCDPHTGIGVLYEYPACILDQGDRVRVYAKLRADVASLKPPTSLHYVAEQRVVKSQHSLYFNCDLFSEKYVEYCFVYVSQAISGAVANVRVDCVPSLPVKDSDTGGWGPWSEWTPCSTNCLGGTRNRYRFCDSPPPRYGAKFCEGSSVQTEKCGKTVTDTWDCIYESSGVNSWANNVNRTAVSQEIGPGCRCGCIVHLGSSKPKRIIAGATQSCPGRSFWLVQVDGQETIGLRLNFLRLPCANQYIKVRDGPSLSSTLLIELKGGNNLNLPTATTELLESTGAQLLVEFFTGDVSTTQKPTNGGGIEQQSALVNASVAGVAANVGCTGGFLANVEQIGEKNSSTLLVAATTRLSSVRSRAVAQKPRLRSGFTLVHLSAVIFASIIILISALLGAQYVVRYRKYHLAIARRRDHGSRLHTPRTSMGSLIQPPSRAMSTTTLISEVIYLVKMRPKHQLRHSILRESIDAEALARESEFSGADNEMLAQMAKCDEELGSSNSVMTLRNEPARSVNSADRISLTKSSKSEQHTTTSLSSPVGTLTRKHSADSKDSESIISSGMSSICHSPPPPLNGKRTSRYSERYDAVTLKLRNSHFYESAQDSDSLRSSCIRDYERLNQMALAGRSASASLTNGCYSPAASVVSTATIRTTGTNPKESKEKQNRKKLLARPGSEFSLGNQEELELDYYDYNVINAGAAPGSYLGMDPAYLVWIPPFDDVPDGLCEQEETVDEKTPEPAAYDADEREPLYEEIQIPHYGHYLSPGSNTETPTTNTATSSTCDELSPLSSQQQSKASSPSETNLKNSLIQKAINYVTANNSNNNKNNNTTPNGSKPSTPYVTRKHRRAAKRQQSQSTLSLGNVTHAQESITMHELCATKSARSIAVVHTPASPDESDSYVEKETTVVKSPSDLQDFLALDDIQFADESESDHDALSSAAKERESAQRRTLKEQTTLPTVHKSRRSIVSSGTCEVEV